MLPATCVIRGEYNEEQTKNICPLCSDTMIKQKTLVRELGLIEQKYLGIISNDAIARIQYDYYCASYKNPLQAHGRQYEDITITQIKRHFATCRISHERMILEDVQHVTKAQRNIMCSMHVDDPHDAFVLSESNNDNNIKTWMQLSKHKHELMKLLEHKNTTANTKHNRLHSV
jgi:hypothetical protein